MLGNLVLATGRKAAIGLAGIGSEIVCVAAVALNAPAPVWVLALLVGAMLILVALGIGERESGKDSLGSVPSTVMAQGGSGEGDLRGNIFGDNATITVTRHERTPNGLDGKRLVQASVGELIQLYDSHTKLQAKKLLEPYLGGWLLADGVVNDVSEGAIGLQVAILVENQLVFATFQDDAQEDLPRLRKGDRIVAVGRISEVDLLWLRLKDAEMLDPSPAP